MSQWNRIRYGVVALVCQVHSIGIGRDLRVWLVGYFGPTDFVLGILEILMIIELDNERLKMVSSFHSRFRLVPFPAAFSTRQSRCLE